MDKTKTKDCRACGMNMWLLAGPTHGVLHVCPRCDTSAQKDTMRVGPPNAPGTSNGWFTAMFGDSK